MNTNLSFKSNFSSTQHEDDKCQIMLRNVALRFIKYNNKKAKFKEVMLGKIGLNLSHLRPSEEFWALDGINLKVLSGDRLGIIGPNGAGKSTLLRLIAGIYLPTKGCIEVSGKVAPLIDIGAGFNNEISAMDNIILYGSLLGYCRREMEEKIERILDFAGVQEFAGMPTKYYSTGMLRRLAFSLATDIIPDILLVDEVFSSGDANFQKKAKKRMLSLINSAKSMVMVSHNMNLIKDLCNKVILLNRGQMVAEGAPDETIDYYLNDISLVE